MDTVCEAETPTPMQPFVARFLVLCVVVGMRFRRPMDRIPAELLPYGRTGACNSIKTWWNEMGKTKYPHARELLITADCGGSNGYRVKLWKVELQKFANETGMLINICHFPPGTSKWNKIEHKMFSFISQNWRGKPLITSQNLHSVKVIYFRFLTVLFSHLLHSNGYG